MRTRLTPRPPRRWDRQRLQPLTDAGCSKRGSRRWCRSHRRDGRCCCGDWGRGSRRGRRSRSNRNGGRSRRGSRRSRQRRYGRCRWCGRCRYGSIERATAAGSRSHRLRLGQRSASTSAPALGGGKSGKCSVGSPGSAFDGQKSPNAGPARHQYPRPERWLGAFAFGATSS